MSIGVKMTYDACKVWGSAEAYKSKLPEPVQEKLDGELEEMATKKAALLADAATK